MRMQLRKKTQNNQADPVMATPAQAKLLPHVREMDSTPVSPQTAQTEDLHSQQPQGKAQGFNFAEMPIFAEAQAA